MWSQQVVAANDSLYHPRQAFLDNLKAQIAQWQEAGELLMVGVDLNKNTLAPNIVRYWQELGLHNILEKHGRPPATNSTGSKPIDGLYILLELWDIVEGGLYSWQESAISNSHQGIWADLDLVQFLGSLVDLLPSKAMRRLQVKNPTVRKNYVSALEQQYLRHEIPNRVQELQNAFQQSGTTQECIDQRNTLDKLRVQLILQSEATCRTPKIGRVPWTATFQHAPFVY